MMGSSKHLKQLLREDQEPFVLSAFLHDKRSQLHKPIQLRRDNPVARNSIFSANLCRNACFFAFRSAPDTAKSPLFEFSSRPKASNGLFVRIPVETAALLLEAALRIESEPNGELSKKKNIGFGFIGTILRKIKRRKRKNEAQKSGGIEVKHSLQTVCRNVSERREQEVETTTSSLMSLGVEEKRSSDVGLSCSCNSRVSSAWTESNEEKSLETSTSRSEASDDEGEQHVTVTETECAVDLCETGSPFRFSSPERISPAISPNRRKNQVDKQNEEKQTSYEGKEQKEEMEFFSPVSVLELEIDDVEVQDEDENDEEDDAEYERSFAFVQKAKLKLLKRLLRFERLAQLDPLELDKRITEHENDDEEEEDDDDDEEEEDQEGGCSVLQKNGDNGIIVREVLKGSSCSNRRRIPFNMKRLDRDLMGSEGAVTLSSDRIFVANKLCKRLGTLKGVERNTIHMINTMAEIDFRGEQNQWRKNSEEVEETVVAVECAIFGFLLDELAVELFHSDDLY